MSFESVVAKHAVVRIVGVMTVSVAALISVCVFSALQGFHGRGFPYRERPDYEPRPLGGLI